MSENHDASSERNDFVVSEHALIGSVVRYGSIAVAVINAKADPMTIFRDSLHSIIFRAASDIAASGQTVDLDTLAERLGDDPLLETVGGDRHLYDLERAAPDASGDDDVRAKVERLIADMCVLRANATNAPAYSDDYLALRFAAQHEQSLRYVGEFGIWMRYDGKRWAREQTLMAFDLARSVCREASDILKETSQSSDSKVAMLASAKTVAAVERLAKADRRLAATVDQWDVNPMLLNTPGGVIDLATGRWFAHRPNDFMTKITAVTPGGDCPLFKKFLHRITGGDLELQAFLARVFGYCLTGRTVEHALFFFFGTGANGKSVLMETISGVMGDYAQVAPMETFTASKTDRHPTELADLQGARLVIASETTEGRALDEAKIKVMTGGDEIKARKMRQDFYAYRPQFKLILVGNHKPAIKTVDEAIKRRVHLVPFLITIPREERDANLLEKLKPEMPGILQWMIDGCRAWGQIGLSPPDVVTAATAEYLEGEDIVIAWMSECCLVDLNSRRLSSDLYDSYKRFSERAGEQAGTIKTFSAGLEARGFTKKRGSTGVMFIGITLVAP